MDDIRIICNSKIEARKALKDLVIELRQLGLSVNSKKTKIDLIKDQKTVLDCVEEPSQELRYLQALWETRKISAIKSSFAPLKQLALKNLYNDDLTSREFRFAINRLILLSGCKEISVPNSYFSEITDLIITALPEHPSPTDQYVSYLERVPLSDDQVSRIVEFLVNPSLNIYEWQSYRLWALMGVRKITNDSLVRAAMESLKQDDGPSRAGATLFLGANGDHSQKEEIAKNFPNVETFLGQRAALIAIQDLPYKPIVDKYVTGNVRQDLSDVYRNAKKNNLGYFRDPDPVSLTQIIDQERDNVS